MGGGYWQGWGSCSKNYLSLKLLPNFKFLASPTGQIGVKLRLSIFENSVPDSTPIESSCALFHQLFDNFLTLLELKYLPLMEIEAL